MFQLTRFINSLLSTTRGVDYHYGNLRVTLDGYSLPSNAKWSINGGETWHSSGDSIRLLRGNYTVTFRSVSGYNTPQPMQTTVIGGETAQATAYYVYKQPLLHVTLDGGASDGRWSVDGGTTWKSSGTYLVLTAGTYTVTFKDVVGYFTPESQTVEVMAEHTTNVTASYVPCGYLRINLTDGASDGRWSIDNGATWNETGTSLALTPGTYTVTFKGVTDYDTPADITATVTRGTTTTESATYVYQKGWLRVNVSDNAGNSPGRWSIDNGTTWYYSGTSLALTPGTYTVTFKDVTDYDTPTSITVTITKNTTTTKSATYVYQKGWLRVNISGTDDGRWSIDSGTTWQTSGTSLAVTPVTIYTVIFKDVADYNKPTSFTASVSRNTTTTKSAEYVRQTGRLHVTLSGTSDGRWSVDGGATWYTSGGGGGFGVQLPTGPYTVTFKDVTDYDTPTSITVTITKNTQTFESAEYVRQTGRLNVTLSGTFDGRWSVDGGATWYTSGGEGGDGVKLPTGTYTVTFKDVADYNTPASFSATVTRNTTTTESAEYVYHNGWLEVTMSGYPNGSWSVGGVATSYTSGMKIELPPGEYTVYYRDSPYSSLPFASSVMVRSGSTTSITI